MQKDYTIIAEASGQLLDRLMTCQAYKGDLHRDGNPMVKLDKQVDHSHYRRWLAV